MWIIDDSLSFLKVYETVFKDEYDVMTFSTAEKAFEFLDEGVPAPDVCICDYQIPQGMYGDEFFRMATKYFGKTAKYLVSGVEFWKQSCVPLLDVVPVKKPFDNNVMKRQIRSDLEAIAKHG